MAKLCKQCGVKHSNNAIKCLACGAEFNDKHIYARRKKLIILSVLGVLLLSVTLAFAIYSTTPEAAVRRIMYAFKNGDVKTVVSYYPDFYLNSNNIDQRKLLLNTDFNVKILSEDLYTFYLEDPLTPSDRECEQLIETLEYYGGENFDRSKFGDIKMIWVNYRVDIYYFWPKKSTRFIVFEYDGRWCWLPNNVNR